MRFSCPFVINHSGGDETPSCYMNINTATFFCHGCKEKGTAVDMAAYVLRSARWSPSGSCAPPISPAASTLTLAT
jgi:hypothetical protein